MSDNKGFIEKLLNNIGYKKEKLPAWYLDSASVAQYGGIPDMAIYANQADLFRKLSWVNIAVTLVSYAASAVPFQVKKLEYDKAVPVPRHPFEQLLRHPNPEQSQFDFFQHIFSYLMLTGNAYIHVMRASDVAIPIELWVIPTPNIIPVPSEKMGISHYMYKAGLGKERKLARHEVLHIKTFNPNNLFVGLSPIEAIGTVAYGDLKMQEWNTNFFSKQNAKIPGALAFADNIDDVTWKRIKREVQDQWGGTDRFGPMLLRNVGEGVNFVQMGMSQSDMEFIAGRNMNRDEIFSIYAPGLLSMISPDSTEANARIGKATFTEFTLWPMLQLLAEKIANNILPAYGLDLILEYNDIRVTDSLLKIREMREYSTTHTINELRKKYYDDPPLPGEKGNMLPAEVSSFNSGGDFQFREREGGGDTDVGRDGRTAQELKAWYNFEYKRLGKKSKRNFEFTETPNAIQSIIEGEMPIVDAEHLRDIYDKVMAISELI